MLRRVVVLGLFVSLISQALTGGPASADYNSAWKTASIGGCNYQGRHVINLFSYPLAITDLQTGPCATSVAWILSWNGSSATTVGSGSVPGDAVAVGPQFWVPVNSQHTACTTTVCSFPWWHH
jgi:hypothetical protein